MKRSFAALVLGLALAGCAKEADVTDLKGRVDVLETKVDKIQKDLNDLSADVAAVKVVTDAVKANGYVSSVTVNDEGTVLTVVTNGNSQKINIRLQGEQGEQGERGEKGDQGDPGTPGDPGTSPTVSVISESGVLYWAVNGVSTGVKVYEAAPQFKVENNKVMISYDEGKTWTSIGEFVSDYVKPAFKDVDVQEDKVVFTTAEGAVFELPLEKAFALVISAREFAVEAGADISIAYSVVAATEETEIDVLAATPGYKAVIEKKDNASGTVTVSVPNPVVPGEVLVWADNGKGLTSIKKLAFSAEAAVFEVSDVAEVPAEGGVYEVLALSNIDFKVNVVEGAEWLAYVQTKAPVQRTLEFKAEANPTTAVRHAKVEVVRADDASAVLETLAIVQKGGPVATVGEAGYETVQAAVDAAKEGETVKVAAGAFAENVQIGKAITLEGAGAGTILNSIEIYKAAATVKNLTVKPEGNFLASLAEPGYKNPFGIYVHRAGYGAVIDGVTIDMTGNLGTTPTGLFLVNDDSERGESRDVFQNSTIKGVAGQRNAQIYGAKADILNNTVTSGHSGYGIRIGNTGNDIKLDGNKFSLSGGDKTGYAIQFNSLKGSSIVLGENECDDTFKSLYGANNDVNAADPANTFAPEVEYKEGVITIKEAAKGLASRIWGKYNSEGDWDDAVTTRGEWNRSAVLTADKLYVAIAGANAGQYGVAVFDRATGTYQKTITDGIETADAATFHTCGITKMTDGSIFLSNLARNGQKLKIYRLNPETDAIAKVFEYETASGERFGDKMTSSGNLESGLLAFTNYTSGGYIEFRVAGGTWNTIPVRSSYFELKGATPQIGGLYIVTGGVTGERHAIYASNREVNYRKVWTYSTNPMDGWYGDTGQWLSADGNTESNMMDPRWFWYSDGNKYLAYVSSTGSIGSKASGYLRIVKMTGDSWLAQCQNILSEPVTQVFPLGSADDIYATGNVNTNQQGFCDVYNDGAGNVYIAAGLSECGISLFKMN